MTVGLVVATASPAHADHHVMKIRTVFVGTQTTANDAQYIELQMTANGQRVVSTHTVKVYDAGGTTTAERTFTFSSNVANGADQSSVLIATPKASEMFGGIAADLVMAPVIDPAGGKVCYQSTDTSYVDCASFGGYTPLATETGAASAGARFDPTGGLPTGGLALVRRLDRGTPNILDAADDTNNSSVDFVAASRPPRNNAHDVSTKAGVGAGTYEDGSADVQQLGSPWTTTSDAADSGGSRRSTVAVAASAELTFVGPAIRWVARRQPDAGRSDVFIDNIKDSTIDLYDPAVLVQQVVFERLDLTPGTHTIRVTRTGTKNAGSAGTQHVFDAFIVPDTTPPSPPTGLAASVTGSVANLTWAVNGEPDLAGYDVFRSSTAGGPYTKLNGARVVGTAFDDASGAAGALNYYVVSAVDTAGNASSYSNEAAVRLPVGPGTYEETDANVRLVGTWSSTSSANDSGGAVRFSTSPSASAELTFTGSSITWVARRQSTAGIANVFVDGVNVASVDLYNASVQQRQNVFVNTGLGAGSHTIRVVRTGTRNASSTGTLHFLDAFVVA
jgi:hypothetical protein